MFVLKNWIILSQFIFILQDKQFEIINLGFKWFQS